MKNFIGLLICTLLLPLGCSTQRMAVRMALPLVEGQYESIQEELDPDLAEKAIPANLKMMEGFLKADRENLLILRRLAEGFCGYAFSFVEDTNRARASGMYRRGRDYALRALALDTGISGMEQLAPDEFREALKPMQKEVLPALFWVGQCWGGWLLLNLDKPAAFADIPKVEWLMQKALELDESFHYAGPHLFLGAFYGSRSKLLGGDPEKSRNHFERNLELTGSKFLLTRFLYAKTYAVQLQDRELFERQLKAVLESPRDILPQQRLANEVARVKAKRLLQQADELF